VKSTAPRLCAAQGLKHSTSPWRHPLSISGSLLIFSTQGQPLEKLPPPERAAILMTLLGIILLGMFLVVVVLLGGNRVRRLGKNRRGPTSPPMWPHCVRRLPHFHRRALHHHLRIQGNIRPREATKKQAFRTKHIVLSMALNYRPKISLALCDEGVIPGNNLSEYDLYHRRVSEHVKKMAYRFPK